MQIYVGAWFDVMWKILDTSVVECSNFFCNCVNRSAISFGGILQASFI